MEGDHSFCFGSTDHPLLLPSDDFNMKVSGHCVIQRTGFLLHVGKRGNIIDDVTHLSVLLAQNTSSLFLIQVLMPKVPKPEDCCYLITKPNAHFCGYVSQAIRSSVQRTLVTVHQASIL